MINSASGPYFLPNHDRFQEIHSKRSGSAFSIVLYEGEHFFNKKNLSVFGSYPQIVLVCMVPQA